MKTNLLFALLLRLSFASLATGFLPPSHPTSTGLLRTIRRSDAHHYESCLYSFRPDWLRKASGVQPTTEATQQLAESLQRREESLHLVGERFVCRKAGHPVYLFVPTSESDETDESNIIHRLDEGEEVTVTGPRKGNWIDHDGGGWSAMIWDGETRLEQVS